MGSKRQGIEAQRRARLDEVYEARGWMEPANDSLTAPHDRTRLWSDIAKLAPRRHHARTKVLGDVTHNLHRGPPPVHMLNKVCGRKQELGSEGVSFSLGQWLPGLPALYHAQGTGILLAPVQHVMANLVSDGESSSSHFPDSTPYENPTGKAG